MLYTLRDMQHKQRLTCGKLLVKSALRVKNTNHRIEAPYTRGVPKTNSPAPLHHLMNPHP